MTASEAAARLAADRLAADRVDHRFKGLPRMPRV